MRLFLSGVVLAASSTLSFAADLPATLPGQPVPPLPALTWAGFGLHQR
jgi:hypothetical protein